MKVDYLCKSWQFYLQQIVYLVSKGYIYYHVGEIPVGKASKAKKIDGKIIKQYNINLSKYQRNRKKRKKFANFYYLRWKNQFIILHTDGKLEVPNVDDFYNIKTNKDSSNRLRIVIGPKLTVNVVMRGNSPTVVLDKATYKDMREDIDELVKYKRIKFLHNYFKKLNAIPAWSGIVKQKFELQREVYNLAKKYGINTKAKNVIKYPCEYGGLKRYPMWINTFRKPVNKEFKNKGIDEWL